MGCSKETETESVRILLEKGADTNRQAKDKYGEYTALMWASLRNYKNIVEMLLKAGARIDMKNADGSTAIDLARRYGHPEIAEYIKLKTTMRSLQELARKELEKMPEGKTYLKKMETELPKK